MISKERQYRIFNKISEQGFVRIKDLVDEFQCSRSSIMRDLIELENQGKIKRERGGASLKDMPSTLSSLTETSVAVKEQIQIEPKRLICKQAANLIQDGDCVYVDSGTTAMYLAEYLKDKRIQLITPSIYLIRHLPDDFRGEIYLIGGEYLKQFECSCGPLSAQMVRQFHFDQAFLSANGLDLHSGEVYVFDFPLGSLKQEVMKRSASNNLLVDASKLSVKAMFAWANLDEFSHVYIDRCNAESCPDNFVVCELESDSEAEETQTDYGR